MKLHRVLIALLAITISTALFAETPVYTQDKTAIMVSASKPEFVIKLKSNPTTGYSWFLTDYNANLIEPLKHQYEPPTDKKLVGAPGYETWTFRMKSAAFAVPQQTLIRLVYARPWETLDKGQVVTYRITSST